MRNQRFSRILALTASSLIVLAACTSPNSTTDLQPNNESPARATTVLPTLTILLSPTIVATSLSPTPLPVPEAALAVFNPLNPPRPDEVSLEGITSFALLPDNQADGSPAPDFSARLMDGGTFRLSEQTGTYWLVLPTAPGCGECMFSLSMVTQMQPETSSALSVLVLDIYETDDSAYWEAYLSLFEGLDALWSVVEPGNFVVDYNILGLGAFLVIDPEGNLVYRSDSAPRFEYIKHMFTLADTAETQGKN